MPAKIPLRRKTAGGFGDEKPSMSADLLRRHDFIASFSGKVVLPA